MAGKPERPESQKDLKARMFEIRNNLTDRNDRNMKKQWGGEQRLRRLKIR